MPSVDEVVEQLNREWAERFPGRANSAVFSADGTVRLDDYFTEEELSWLLEAVRRLGHAFTAAPPP